MGLIPYAAVSADDIYTQTTHHSMLSTCNQVLAGASDSLHQQMHIVYYSCMNMYQYCPVSIQLLYFFLSPPTSTPQHKRVHFFLHVCVTM